MKMFLLRVSRPIVKYILYIFFKLEVRGIENIKDAKAPAIIASNHPWCIDPFVAGSLLPFDRFPIIRYVTYFRYLEPKIMGSILRFYGAVPCRNGVGVERALKEPRHALERGESVMIFPEGKMNREGKLHYGKPGVVYLARETGAPIIPVALTGTHLSFKRTLLRKQKIIVTFGKPFYVEDKNDLAGAATVMREIKKILPSR
jgi:1-acyl-sn-glycerol-3-phosphate acyltransferase